MLNKTCKITKSVVVTVLMLLFAVGLSACDSAKPPELMKAVKQFESDEIRDAHVKNMRKNHMDELLHKRDETMIKGIRTKEHSLNACINCHVPEKYEGEVLRHTNPKHFCSTCHTYVAQKLDCFQCHVDHPVASANAAIAPNDEVHNAKVVSLTPNLTSSSLTDGTAQSVNNDISKGVNQ